MPSSASPSAARESPSVLSARTWTDGVVAALGHRERLLARPAAPSSKRPRSISPRARYSSRRARCGAVAVRQQLHRPRVGGEALLGLARPSAGSGRAARSRNAARSGSASRVDLGDRGARERERARGLARVGGGRRGVAQHVDAVAARALLGVGDAVPQLQRALEVALGLAEGEHALGGQARPRPRRRARAATSCAAFQWQARIAGDRRGGRVAHQLAARVDGLGEPRVQRAALARQQVAVDGLADQRVAERVRLARAGHEHLVGDRLAQARAAARPRRGRTARRAARGASGARPRSTRTTSCAAAGQPLDARDEQVAQRLGQLLAAVGGGGEQLLGVERVALAALEQAVGELVGRRRVEDRGDLRDQLVAAEALERRAGRRRACARARPAAAAADGGGAARRSGR